MIRRRAALLGTLVAAVALTAVPATANTTTTFEVNDAGTLAITVPDTESFTGLSRSGGEVTFANAITVTDGRDDLSRSWNVVVTDNAGAGFTTVDGDAIQPGEVTYQPGAPVVVSGVLTLSAITTSDETLASGNPAVSASVTEDLGLTEDVVEWTPSLNVQPASGLPDGTYSGTIIHSLSG